MGLIQPRLCLSVTSTQGWSSSWARSSWSRTWSSVGSYCPNKSPEESGFYSHCQALPFHLLACCSQLNIFPSPERPSLGDSWQESLLADKCVLLYQLGFPLGLLSFSLFWSGGEGGEVVDEAGNPGQAIQKGRHHQPCHLVIFSPASCIRIQYCFASSSWTGEFCNCVSLSNGRAVALAS